MPTAFSFGRFELRPASRELTASGSPVRLGARAFDVLQALIERRERVVTKDELLGVVWPGVVVEENNLQVQISILRKVLGHKAITTIPGFGYQFTLGLQTHGVQSDPIAMAPAGAASLKDRELPIEEAARPLSVHGVPSADWHGSPPPYSISILPFSAPSGAATEVQLADSLTRHVTALLARRYPAARVTAHSSAVALRGAGAIDPHAAGRNLNVRYVVEAEVEQGGNSAQVSMRLIDTVSARTEWSDEIHFNAEEVAAGRDFMVARLTETIGRALTATERKRARDRGDDSTADLVSRAASIYSEENLSLAGARKARPLFEEAIRREPMDAQALIGLWWTLNGEYEDNLHSDRDVLVREMDQLATRAVAADWDYAAAWKIKAISLAWQSRWHEALEAIAQARRIDPTDSANIAQNAYILAFMGHPEESLALAELAIKQTGHHTEHDVRIVCWSNVALGRFDVALSACEKTAALSNNWWRDQMMLVALYAITGATEKAAVARAELLREQPTLTIALLRRQRYSDHPEFLKWWEGVLYEGLLQAGVPAE